MKLGIVGLPNVGKSMLFNALTRAGAETVNYPFSTVKPNVGIVSVPDERLNVLAQVYKPLKITPATIEFVDIAGLARGASRGEGLGNQFLSFIREVDAVVHVVRCFDDDNVVHVEGGANPSRDVEIIGIELSLGDLDIVNRRLDKTRKLAKADKSFLPDIEILEQLAAHLDDGNAARAFETGDRGRHLLSEMPLLSGKPTVYAANLDENGYNNYQDNAYFQELQKIADAEGAKILPVCAKLEAELSAIEDDEERALFMSELGLERSGLDRLIGVCYDLLGLISYLTAGAPEVRAWTIAKGTRAPQAAGKIHSDFERGFIRAEVVSFDDFMRAGSTSAARDKGLLRSEGKNYVVNDGDVINYLFNV
jgi:hypothetical protein